ncbi:MAG: divalent-cation tolerance protein CutA [Candidatus Norongarragalinales archaeon]
MKILFCYVTCKNAKEAEELAHALVEKKTAACSVAVHDARSFFAWKGHPQRTSESVLFLKTLPKNRKKLEREIRKMHSYETPCIIFFNAECSEDYWRWLKNVVK